MNDAEKLLRDWRLCKPKDGAKCEDALKVAKHLGLKLNSTPNSQGHYQASHPSLIGSPQFPFGSITINCHARGVQGRAHPSAIKDILKAADIIAAAIQEEQ